MQKAGFMKLKGFVLAAILAALGSACDGGPTTAPSTQPATRPVSYRNPRERADAARAAVLARMARDPAYVRACADSDRLKLTLDQARRSGTTQEKLEASSAWNTTRITRDRMLDEAFASDVEYQAAVKEAAEAVKPKPEVAQSPATASDPSATAGTPPATDSNGKTVHVDGYTRKDGTVVKPYDRAAPGSGSSKGGRR